MFIDKLIFFSLLIGATVAQQYAIAYGYDKTACTGDLKYLKIWDARCTDDDGADSSRYYSCSGTTFQAYVPCDKKGCPSEYCNAAPVPNGCVPFDNTTRVCSSVLPTVPTGWYIMKQYTEANCGGYIHTYDIWSPSYCVPAGLPGKWIRMSCDSNIYEHLCNDDQCSVGCVKSTIGPINTCYNAGGQSSYDYTCGTGGSGPIVPGASIVIGTAPSSVNQGATNGAPTSNVMTSQSNAVTQTNVVAGTTQAGVTQMTSAALNTQNQVTNLATTQVPAVTRTQVVEETQQGDQNDESSSSIVVFSILLGTTLLALFLR